MSQKYPAIPLPTPTVQGLWDATMAIKQTLDILTGAVGSNNNNAAVTFSQLATTSSTLSPSYFRNFKDGFILSYVSGAVLGISDGVCVDSTRTTFIKAGAFTKSTAGAWAAGSGANGMGKGLTIANGTWYCVFAAIINGTPDFFFDTDVNAANAPNGTACFRRVGRFKTDGSANILNFTQELGGKFLWIAQVVEATDNTPPDTSAHLLTLTGVPTGLVVEALFRFRIDYVSSTMAALVTSPFENDVAAVDPYTTLVTSSTSTRAGTHLAIITDTLARIRLRTSSTAGTYSLASYGWVDPFDD